MNRFYHKHNFILVIKLVLILAMFLNGNVFAQNLTVQKIPHIISFNGKIKDKVDNDIPNGNYTVMFSLFASEQGGEPIWSETFPNLRIENGVLDVALGTNEETNPITVTFDKKYFLSITINGDLNTSKRIGLSSVAYSLGSDYAEEVADGSVTTDKISPLAVTDEKIKSFDWQKITDVDPDPYSIYWTIMGNIIFGPDRNYVGTVEAKDFVLKTFSKERMRFGPTGRVTLGTPTDTVRFVVIGKTKCQDVFVRKDMGVGVWPALAKVHVRTQDITPFKVQIDNTTRFQVSKDGKVEINADLAGGAYDDKNAYPLFLHSPGQGIAIKVNVSGASNDNNFVSFWNDKGMKGRIEGETILNYWADPLNIARSAETVALTTADILAIGIQEEDPEIEPASLIAFTAGVIYNGITVALEESQIGVTYESGSGDYAEWLERISSDEKIKAGDIVGVYNGKISKSTNNADQLLCVSHSPIVLGNKPKKGKEYLFEKVAFLGQVPVKVSGTVKKGDYIIPSGMNDGCGVAISPDLITIDEFTKIVGRAWESSDSQFEKYINTAIGFDNRDIINILKIYEAKSKAVNSKLMMRNQKIIEAENKLNKLLFDFDKLELQYKNASKNFINTKNN